MQINAGITLIIAGDLTNNFTGTINNDGTVSNTSTLFNFFGIINNNATGVLTNNGAINNQSTGTINNDGRIDNNSIVTNDGNINNKSRCAASREPYTLSAAGEQISPSDWLLTSSRSSITLFIYQPMDETHRLVLHDGCGFRKKLFDNGSWL